MAVLDGCKLLLKYSGGSRLSLSNFRQHSSHLLHLDRLRQKHVHTARERFLPRRRVAQTRDSHDDRSRASTRILKASDRTCGFEAVQDGHIDVHYHDLRLDRQL